MIKFKYVEWFTISKMNKLVQSLDSELDKLNVQERTNYLRSVYKQVSISNKARTAGGKYNSMIHDASSEERGEFTAHVSYLLFECGEDNLASKVYKQNVKHIGEYLNQVNEKSFFIPYANGLRKELLERNGREHVFSVSEPMEVEAYEPFNEIKRYNIIMDGEVIGSLERAIGPRIGTQPNIEEHMMYVGIIPGYTKRSAFNVNEGNPIIDKTEKVVLQSTNGVREDSHNELQFLR